MGQVFVEDSCHEQSEGDDCKAYREHPDCDLVQESCYGTENFKTCGVILVSQALQSKDDDNDSTKGSQTVVEYDPLREEDMFLEQKDEADDKDTAES